MSSEVTFRIIFLALLGVFVSYPFARHPQQLGSRSIRQHWKQASEWEGRLRVALRAALFPFWLTAVILYMVYPDWITHYALPFPTWLRWIGVGLATVILPLVGWAIHALGDQFSPRLQLREGHRLVSSGPYRWMRHPMYTAEFVFYTGLAVESANWLVALAMIAGPVLLYARVSKEEAMMIERFGDEYRAYMKRTGRFLPSFHFHKAEVREDSHGHRSVESEA